MPLNLVNKTERENISGCHHHTVPDWDVLRKSWSLLVRVWVTACLSTQCWSSMHGNIFSTCNEGHNNRKRKLQTGQNWTEQNADSFCLRLHWQWQMQGANWSKMKKLKRKTELTYLYCSRKVQDWSKFLVASQSGFKMKTLTFEIRHPNILMYTEWICTQFKIRIQKCNQ